MYAGSSRAAPWWFTLSMQRAPLRLAKKRDRQTDGRQAVTLRLQLNAASVINQSSKQSINETNSVIYGERNSDAQQYRFCLMRRLNENVRDSRYAYSALLAYLRSQSIVNLPAANMCANCNVTFLNLINSICSGSNSTHSKNFWKNRAHVWVIILLTNR